MISSNAFDFVNTFLFQSTPAEGVLAASTNLESVLHNDPVIKSNPL